MQIRSGQIAKDHVHLLVSCPPSLSVAKIVQYLKGRSSRLFQEEFPASEKAVLGSAPLGPGVLLRDRR